LQQVAATGLAGCSDIFNVKHPPILNIVTYSGVIWAI